VEVLALSGIAIWRKTIAGEDGSAQIIIQSPMNRRAKRDENTEQLGALLTGQAVVSD